MVHCKMALLVKGTISFYLFNLFKKLGCFLSSIASDDRDGHGWTWISQKQKLGGRAPPPPPHVLVPKNTFTDVFYNTCDIGDFRAHIFCPQTKAKEHQEAGAPEQLPPDVQSIKDTLDNAKIAKRFACANEQRKRTFWKI